MKTMPYFALAIVWGGAAFAESHVEMGDPAAGEKVFNQCQACHVVQNEDGETLAGRNGRVGPNLYGIAGRAAGSIEDYRYSTSLSEAGEAGLEWDAESFGAYVLDPTGYLREYLDDSGARGKMSFKLRSEEDAQDVYAYIKSLGGGAADEEGNGDES